MAEKVFSAPIIDNSNSAFAIAKSGETYSGVYHCEFYAADLDLEAELQVAAIQYSIDNGETWQDSIVTSIAPEYDSGPNLATKYLINIPLLGLELNPIVPLTISIISIDKNEDTRVISSTINIQGVSGSSCVTLIKNKAGDVNITSMLATQTYNAIFTDGLAHTVSGKYSVNSGDTDYLSWYRIILKDSNNIALEDTSRQPILEESPNTFSYTLQTAFDAIGNPQYQMYVIYGTHKGLLETQIIDIGIEEVINQANDIEILNFSAISNAELGCIELTLETRFSRADFITLIIKRFDGIKISVIYQGEPALASIITLIDYSAEAGTNAIYKAYYEYVNAGSVYRSQVKTANATFLIDDIYLLGDNLLKVKYNPDLSSLKFNYADTITPTLGSAYPFARRNGHQKYRTFTIGGLISYNSEKYDYTSSFGIDSTGSSNPAGSEFLNSSFLTDTEFETYKDLDHYDRERIYEKIFRNKVLDFLHSPSVKLFKSLPEGDMLVRLSNVSLTPNKQLDRNIYSFSATATEMAEATVENMIKFGIVPAKIKDQPVYYNEYVLEGTLVDDETVETSSVENEDTLILEKVQTEI